MPCRNGVSARKPGSSSPAACRLPPVPGPVQSVLDDRKRQEASAFVWAHVTQREPRFAPRPIEAGQPEQVRKNWTGRRGNLWHKLARLAQHVWITSLPGIRPLGVISQNYMGAQC